MTTLAQQKEEKRQQMHARLKQIDRELFDTWHRSCFYYRLLTEDDRYYWQTKQLERILKLFGARKERLSAEETKLKDDLDRLDWFDWSDVDLDDC